MNTVNLIGRLTKDPEVSYTQSQMAVSAVSLAVDRPVKAGEEKKTDYPRVIVYGKQAESLATHMGKGCMISVSGRIQTGSYKNKSGETVYTTDVIANRIEFLSWPEKKKKPVQETFVGFAELDEAVPF